MGASANITDDTHAEPRRAAADAEQPTGSFLGATGDRCAACGTALASDQRYCLACGERRGKARFPTGAAAPTATEARAAAHREHQHPRLSSGTALIAGIATLLLALGVGVLIGRIHSNTGTPAAAHSPVQVITVGGGSASGAGAAAAATSTSGSATTARGARHTAAAARSKTVVITKQVQAKAAAASSKVLGGNIQGPAVVTVGQPGHGPGYTNGHFTGQFFGP
jgi:hypothetical protein